VPEQATLAGSLPLQNAGDEVIVQVAAFVDEYVRVTGPPADVRTLVLSDNPTVGTIGLVGAVGRGISFAGAFAT